MKISAVNVEKCRNIEKAELFFKEGLTVICGENGQGKTNLLECLFLLTGSKSFRAAKDAQLVMQGEKTARVTGRVEKQQREYSIEIEINTCEGEKKGRSARVNQVAYGRAANIAGVFTAVVFEPNHLGLIKGGPEGRRRFIDAALCQIYPGYLQILRRYTRALSQKNILLRRYHGAKDAAAQLDVFDIEMAASGEEISQRRGQYLAGLIPAALQYYAQLSQGKEQLDISYSPSAQKGGLLQLQAAQRSADISAGFCTKGPHREDFVVKVCASSARIFGSQGQQRSAVLALKLAEASVAKTLTGQHPVLLLDDVLSELDEKRQAYLLGNMQGKQSFVTTCDETAFSRTAGAVIHIKAGQIVG